MRYFDFHAHIILKQLFDENPNIDTRINTSDVSGVPRLCTDLPNIIRTQIHQSQLANFRDEVVIGVALYAMESFLADAVLPLRNNLRSEARHKLSEQLLTNVSQNHLKSFTGFTLERTLAKYLNAPESFNVLTSVSFNQPLPRNKVNIFFVIEGCHSLVDQFNRFQPPPNHFPPSEILKNLDMLLEKIKVISINLTHLQQSNLCNHAFGIQLTRMDPFFPSGNGLEDHGREVVQGLFDRGICVDVKHMSYKSRRDLRDEIDAGQFSNIQPLVCTHAAFTGVPFREWAGYISLKRTLRGAILLELAKTMQTRNSPNRPGAPAFNMTTINLFDEEIEWIVRNGGMIGLSMDRRILGFVNKFDFEPTGSRPDSVLIVDKEFFSKDEFAALGIRNSEIGSLIEEGDCVTITDLEESIDQSIPARDEYFFDHVLLQLKHYFQVCHDAGITIQQAQKHITIGSDYDGLINPFLNMPTVLEMVDLKKYIQMNFRFYLDSLTDSREWAAQLDVNQFAEDFFFNNGLNFIRSRL